MPCRWSNSFHCDTAGGTTNATSSPNTNYQHQLLISRHVLLPILILIIKLYIYILNCNLCAELLQTDCQSPGPCVVSQRSCEALCWPGFGPSTPIDNSVPSPGDVPTLPGRPDPWGPSGHNMPQHLPFVTMKHIPNDPKFSSLAQEISV